MATTLTENRLSGSTDGRQIPLNAGTTHGSASVIHQATAGSATWDIVRLMAHNVDTLDHLVTVYFGGSAYSDKRVVNVPGRTPNYPLVEGDALQNGAEIRAHADTGSVVMISGGVMKVTGP